MATPSAAAIARGRRRRPGGTARTPARAARCCDAARRATTAPRRARPAPRGARVRRASAASNAARASAHRPAAERPRRRRPGGPRPPRRHYSARRRRGGWVSCPMPARTAPHSYGRHRRRRGRRMTSTHETFQLTAEVAEAYEAAVRADVLRPVGTAPARRGRRAPAVSACSTWPAAPASSPAARPSGSAAPASVVGVDLSEAMLAVAGGSAPISVAAGRRGRDAVRRRRSSTWCVCQMAMMFFPDPVAALREMRRVARPTGTVGGARARARWRPTGRTTCSWTS